MEKPDLLHFLPAAELPLKVLVLESSACLPHLRELLPKAEIRAVTADAWEAREEKYRHLGILWQVMDYEAEPLPFERGYFDYIIAERYLESLVSPRDITAGLGDYLKGTGFLLTSFLNIRCWRVIEELKAGHFYDFMARPLAKPEAVRVLGVSLYKDITFAPCRLKAPDGLIDRLVAEGYDNFNDDLETELWLVRAGRSEAGVEALKSIYTPELRREIAKLLRRIEYEVGREEALSRLRELCGRESVFPEYLADFAQSISTRPEKLLTLLELD